MDFPLYFFKTLLKEYLLSKSFTHDNLQLYFPKYFFSLFPDLLFDMTSFTY